MLPDQVSGALRITSTDTVLHALVAPALRDLMAVHPLLTYELHTGNELANLTRRDADIAVRATKRPPQHLVGKHVGPIRVALFGAKKGSVKRYADVEQGRALWVAPDDALPEHPSVLWRKRQFPKVLPQYKVNSILTVMELVALGFGVGVLPLFLAKSQPNLIHTPSRGTCGACRRSTGTWLERSFWTDTGLEAKAVAAARSTFTVPPSVMVSWVPG